jgi:hypothetical protein
MLIAVHEFALFAYLRIFTGQNKQICADCYQLIGTCLYKPCYQWRYNVILSYGTEYTVNHVGGA